MSFTIVLMISGVARAGVFEAMSEGAYYLSNGFASCASVDEAKTASALAAARENCPPGVNHGKDPLKPLADVAMKVEGSQEDQFFALLGRQQNAELLCAADFADKLKAGDDKALEDLEKKFALLRHARQGMMVATREMQADPALFTNRCPLSLNDPDLKPDAWRAEIQGGKDLHYEVCRRMLTYRTALEAVSATIPLGGTQSLQNLMRDFSLVEASGSEEERLRSGLRERLKAAYRGAATELRQEAGRMEGLWRSGGTGIDRKERGRLVSDPLLVQSVLRQSGRDQDLRALACRADARYGSGATALEDGLFIGSFALSGGAALVARAGTVAARAAMGLNSARAGGLLSLNAARALQITAAGAGGLSAYQEIDNACGPANREGVRAVGSGENQCVSAPRIETLEKDSCYLAVGLGALGLGASLAPELHAAAQKLRREPGAPSVAGRSDDEVVAASPRASAAGGAGSAEEFSPLKASKTVSQAEVQRTHDESLARLAAMGVKTERIGTDTALEGDFWSRIELTDLPPGAASARGFRGEIHRITELPKPVSRGTPSTPALQHPEMAEALRRARELGYDVVLDTTVTKTGAGAYFDPFTRRIALKPNSTWATFQHELQHLEFSEYVRPNMAKIRRIVDAKGDLTIGLPADVVADIGRERLQKIDSLIRRGVTPTNSIDESLSVDGDLRALGWRRYLPTTGGPEIQRYALRHRITDLTALKAVRPLTPEEARALEDSIRQHRQLELYQRHGNAALLGTGGLVGATGVGAGLYTELTRDSGFERIYYDTKGNLVGVRADGSWKYIQSSR